MGYGSFDGHQAYADETNERRHDLMELLLESSIENVFGEFPGNDNLAVVHRSNTCFHAVSIMNSIGVGAAIVVGDQDDIIGIITERDIAKRAIRDDLNCPVSRHMTHRVYSLPQTAKMAFLFNRFAVDGFRHIPIMDGIALVGIVSARSVLQYLNDNLASHPIFADRVFHLVHDSPQRRRKELVVTPETSLLSCLECMDIYAGGGVSVIENDALIGYFSERDVIRKVASQNIPLTCPVKDIMTSSLLTISPADTIREAMLRMTRHHIRHLPITTDTNQYEGMIVQRDIIEYVASQWSAEVFNLPASPESAEFWDERKGLG